MNAQRFHAITNAPSGWGLTSDTGRWFNNVIILKRGTLNEHLSMKFRFERSTLSHHRTFAAENDATQHCRLSPVSGTRRVCSMAYILGHKRVCPTTDTRQPSLRDSTDMNAEGPMGPGRLYPTHCRLPGTDIELQDPSSLKKLYHNTHLCSLGKYLRYLITICWIYCVDILHLMNLSCIRLYFHM